MTCFAIHKGPPQSFNSSTPQKSEKNLLISLETQNQQLKSPLPQTPK
jgi:hypothetical protein